MTPKGSVEHIATNKIVLANNDDSVALVDHDLQSYVPSRLFRSGAERISSETCPKVFCATTKRGRQNTVRQWSETK